MRRAGAQLIFSSRPIDRFPAAISKRMLATRLHSLLCKLRTKFSSQILSFARFEKAKYGQVFSKDEKPVRIGALTFLRNERGNFCATNKI
jgi:hypothetical protein